MRVERNREVVIAASLLARRQRTVAPVRSTGSRSRARQLVLVRIEQQFLEQRVARLPGQRRVDLVRRAAHLGQVDLELLARRRRHAPDALLRSAASCRRAISYPGSPSPRDCPNAAGTTGAAASGVASPRDRGVIVPASATAVMSDDTATSTTRRPPAQPRPACGEAVATPAARLDVRPQVAIRARSSRGSDCSSASTRVLIRVVSSTALLRVHAPPEQLPGTVQLRLAGPDRHCRACAAVFLVRVPVDPGQHEHVSRAGRQAGDRPLRGRPWPRCRRPIPSGSASASFVLDRGLGTRDSLAPAPCLSQHRVHGDPVQPGAEARSAPRSAAGCARPARRLPACSLRPFRVVPSSAGTARRPCPHAPIEPLERRRRAGGGRLDQAAFVRRLSRPLEFALGPRLAPTRHLVVLAGTPESGRPSYTDAGPVPRKRHLLTTKMHAGRRKVWRAIAMIASRGSNRARRAGRPPSSWTGPEVRNAVDPPTAAALAAAFPTLDADDAIARDRAVGRWRHLLRRRGPARRGGRLGHRPPARRRRRGGRPVRADGTDPHASSPSR